MHFRKRISALGHTPVTAKMTRMDTAVAFRDIFSGVLDDSTV